MCSRISRRTVSASAGDNASTTWYIFWSVNEYMRLLPSLRHRTKPESFKILKCLEMTGWMRLRWGTISQTHFSPSRRKSIISILTGSESALKIVALSRLGFSGLADKLVHSGKLLLTIFKYSHQTICSFWSAFKERGFYECSGK